MSPNWSRSIGLQGRGINWALASTFRHRNPPDAYKRHIRKTNEYQLYNTVVFLLSSLMLSNPPLSSDDREASPSVPDLLGQRWDAAYNICRAVPYDLFEKHGGGGAYLILFPLLTTLRLFGEGSDEGKWIKHVLGSIANKWGLEGERKYMAFEG